MEAYIAMNIVQDFVMKHIRLPFYDELYIPIHTIDISMMKTGRKQ